MQEVACSCSIPYKEAACGAFRPQMYNVEEHSPELLLCLAHYTTPVCLAATASPLRPASIREQFTAATISTGGGLFAHSLSFPLCLFRFPPLIVAANASPGFVTILRGRREAGMKTVRRKRLVSVMKDDEDFVRKFAWV
ncbi:hypothetical protein O3P69_003636 [Scylla paramamosain]|uniref:Uncharacterized protein n=1 Tax=Scylla paramamosain TaxID=85552 RepID=A0AAW0UKL3_SCYPA